MSRTTFIRGVGGIHTYICMNVLWVSVLNVLKGVRQKRGSGEGDSQYSAFCMMDSRAELERDDAPISVRNRGL